MRKKKRLNGAAITETAASMIVLLPFIFTMLYVGLEIAQAYLIDSTLGRAARLAARELALIYPTNTSIATNRALQEVLVFDKIRINNIINASQQFTNPVFNENSDPPTVTVTVQYRGNQYGLPPFPNPDPLNLGSAIQLSAQSIYRLE